MKRTLAFVPAALLALAGCGDTCSSEPATVQQLPAACSVAADTPVTIAVQLCASCKDTSPSCVAEFVGGELQLDTAFQRCEANAACAVTGACDAVNSQVTCVVRTPAVSGTYPIVAGPTLVPGQIVISAGGGTSCTL